MWYRVASHDPGRSARAVCVLAALAFVHAFAIRPVLLPECLAHGFGDGAMAHAMPGHSHDADPSVGSPAAHDGSPTHHAGASSHHGSALADPAGSSSHLSGISADHADAPSNSAEECICLEVCLCEFGGPSPAPALAAGPIAIIAAGTIRPLPESPTLIAPRFRLPLATGPPHAL